MTKKGYTTRLAEIKTQITNLLSLAANEKDNDAALAAFNKALADAKVSDAITAAETALADNKVCTGDGRAFFKGELDKYKAEYTKVLFTVLRLSLLSLVLLRRTRSIPTLLRTWSLTKSL